MDKKAQLDINLFKREILLPPRLLLLENILTKLGWVILLSLLIGGVLTISLFLVAKIQDRTLQKNVSQVSAQLKDQVNKEVIYSLFKEKLGIVKKVRKSQNDWGLVLTQVKSLGLPPQLNTLRVEEGTRLVAGFRFSSFADILELTKKIEVLINEQKIQLVDLTALEVGQDGIVQISISFLPKFTSPEKP